jgi:hypothetical protein
MGKSWPFPGAAAPEKLDAHGADRLSWNGSVLRDYDRDETLRLELALRVLTFPDRISRRV